MWNIFGFIKNSVVANKVGIDTPEKYAEVGIGTCNNDGGILDQRAESIEYFEAFFVGQAENRVGVKCFYAARTC